MGNVRLVFTESNGLASIVQENHYYPFGMQQNGNWAKSQTVKNDYLYNGKELNTEIGLNWSDYGFRFYDSAVGRFTGVDPISDKFAHVSVYNYAENRVPNGIDLWGLQFVSANDAKIIFQNGGASLKEQNMSRPTRTRIKYASPVSGTTSNGGSYISTTFPTSVGSLNFNSGSGIKKAMPNKSTGIVTQVAKSRPGGGSAPQRKKWNRAMKRQGLQPGQNTMKPIAPGRGGGALALGMFLLDIGNIAVNGTVNNDLKQANGQFNLYGGILKDIMDNANIPAEFQNEKMLSDIANYVFQGAFVHEYDDDTFQQLKDISQTLIIANDINLNCKECQESQ